LTVKRSWSQRENTGLPGEKCFMKNQPVLLYRSNHSGGTLNTRTKKGKQHVEQEPCHYCGEKALDKNIHCLESAQAML
jgi:hypothetical protein